MKKPVLLILILVFIFHTFTAAQDNTKIKIACFLAKDFPTVDAPVISESNLKEALSKYDVEYLSDVNSFNQKVSATSYKLLILPCGSAFPLDAWQTIQNFLNSGGSLVYLGENPFHQPVMRKDSTWVLGIPQQTFARQLLIGPADKIELNSNNFYRTAKTVALNEFDLSQNYLPNPKTVYEMTVRFTTQKDFKDEDGSSGPREAVMRPLIHILNNDNLPIASPLVEIDRLQGDNAGARWIFSTGDAKLSPALIEKIVDRALEGSVEFNANPIFANLFDSEIPQIRINLFRPKQNEAAPVSINMNVKNSKGNIVFTAKSELAGLSDFKTATISIKTAKPLSAGFYSVEIEAHDVTWHPNKITTGFWIWDKELASRSPKITTSKDWLLKDGKAFPIIGTTYMASDVHRKFLIEPNPFVWEKDFARMQSIGINFVRTGLWTAWSRIMLDRGAIDESFLRALDAYVMTAARHNIVVCFNFFAFTPPLNGGKNPYLDPRAIDWQKTFITLISKRYKNIGWVQYDLINEPSYSPPTDLWKTAPIGDAYESYWWKFWLTKKFGDNPVAIQNKWRDSRSDVYAPPYESDLHYKIYKEDGSQRKGMDFNLFVQDVVKHWADTLNKLIKKTSGALVTLGQDEGGTSNRPSQQFCFPSVDYTSIHTWWLNDDLLWDGVFAKVPEKPNLISETGMMRLEDIDGEPWRSPEDALKLLDRKFALAFAARSAGVVEWAWNINPYMNIDNEAVIGFFRPDGTAKFEIQAIKKFADFFESAKSKLEDFESPEVAVMIPHSKIFSGLKYGDLSTKRFVRTLADHFGVVPTLLSEYKLTDERLAKIKLLIVPSVEFLEDSAAVTIYKAALHGTKILFTGALEGNAYGELDSTITKLGLNNKSIPVSLFESVTTAQGQPTITFENQQSEFIRKCSAETFYSVGNIMHEPLPLELARESEPLINLLKHALDLSGIKYQFSETPISTGILQNENYALVICVNESSALVRRNFEISGYQLSLDIAAGESKLLLIDKKTGNVISETK